MLRFRNYLVAWTTINYEQSIIFLYKVTQGANHAVERRSRELTKRGHLDLNWFHWKALAEKRKARAWKVSGTQGKFSIVKSLFTISLAGIRTKQILREKAGCKQSRKTFLNVWNKHDLETRNIVRRDLRVYLNNRVFLLFFVARWSLCRASSVLKLYFFRRTETFSGHENGLCKKRRAASTLERLSRLYEINTTYKLVIMRNVTVEFAWTTGVFFAARGASTLLLSKSCFFRTKTYI